MTALFAMVLFLGAVSTRLELVPNQVALLVAGGIVFIASVTITATFPVKV
jgi:hypothetical protein